MKENIAIIACSNWKFYDVENIPKEMEIWTLNGMCEVLKRIDLHFDMHNWLTCEYEIPDYYYFLKKKKNKYSIVKSSKDSNLKNVVLYPIEEIMRVYGRNLKNSIPEMILYAWYLNHYKKGKIKNIFLYGISNDEFVRYPEMGFSFYQAIGFVRGQGINVFFVNETIMEDDHDIYGYFKLTEKKRKP
jgi:hypothetical protein